MRAGQHIVVLVVAYSAQAGLAAQKEQHDRYVPLLSGQQLPSRKPRSLQMGLEAHVAVAWGYTKGWSMGNCGPYVILSSAAVAESVPSVLMSADVDFTSTCGVHCRPCRA